MDVFLQAAIEEAQTGLAAGGIPIGSVLVLDGKIIGRGHNQRVQHGSVIHHAEMNCLENAGRLKASIYQRCILYSTLSPCPMCLRADPAMRDCPRSFDCGYAAAMLLWGRRRLCRSG